MMDFSLSAEQQAMVEQARAFTKEWIAPKAVDRLEKTPDPFSPTARDRPFDVRAAPETKLRARPPRAQNDQQIAEADEAVPVEVLHARAARSPGRQDHEEIAEAD